MKLRMASLAWWLIASALQAGGIDSEYPVVDPYEATVIGTPPELRYRFENPRALRERIFALEVFPNREIPGVFWPAKRLEISLAYQKSAAPLIFVIAGTGSSYRSSTTQFLRDTFYQAGFHVISLSSPSSYDFITSASSSRYPGISSEDAEDLYRVMKLAWAKVMGRIDVTDFYLTGYSLGAAHAAFVSHRDEEEKVFSFKKVLLLNPPVNLYASAMRLDRLFGSDPSIRTSDELLERLLRKFAGYFKERGMISLDDEAFLFKFQESDQSLSTPEIKTLIGAAFRFTAAGMVFTVDVLNDTGYVVEKGKDLTIGVPLELYLKRSLWWGFADYFDRMLTPYWQRRHPQESRDDLIHRISLLGLADYLSESGKIGVISNEDEIILDTQDLQFLRETFGSRAKIFPFGGHGGNMQHAPYVRQMLRFFESKGSAPETQG
jgi:hypothetical protein